MLLRIQEQLPMGRPPPQEIKLAEKRLELNKVVLEQLIGSAVFSSLHSSRGFGWGGHDTNHRSRQTKQTFTCFFIEKIVF